MKQYSVTTQYVWTGCLPSQMCITVVAKDIETAIAQAIDMTRAAFPQATSVNVQCIGAMMEIVG